LIDKNEIDLTMEDTKGMEILDRKVAMVFLAGRGEED